jgi:two-component system, LytTR family, sensor kinase
MSSNLPRDEPLISDPVRRWLVIGAVWTGVAGFFVLQGAGNAYLRGEPVPSWIVRSEFAYWWAWIPLTGIALFAARRFRISHSRLWPTLAAHCAVAVLVAVCHELLLFALSSVLTNIAPITPPGQEIGRRILQRAPYMMSTTFYKYWVVVGIYYGFDYARKYRERQVAAAELKTRLAEAELRALRMQLQPHFLFNTLHAVSMLNFSDVDAANRMLVRLSDLLRMSLDNSGRQTVPFSTELDFLSKYLEIEQTRFNDRLTVSYQVDPALLSLEVPNLILQPLVENAVRHGVAKLARNGRIDINATLDAGDLVLSVCDNGPGLTSASTERASGIGLSNTRARLEQTYGRSDLLRLNPRTEGGVCAEVRIPQ